MKKEYSQPEMLDVRIQTNSLMDGVTGSVDPGSISNEGEEDLGRRRRSWSGDE